MAPDDAGSAERGTTITVEICFSASGQYIPPMMVFPRKRMDPQLMLNAAPGSWGVCSDSGWMTTELFLGWFKKFVTFSGATIERPVLLLLDGHSTHTQNIELINEARSHGVIILCFPPHTTHRLQVADVAYMRPLSTFYDQQITAWLRSNPGMVVTVRQVAEIFGKAFIQASSMATAVNGFRKCGIWPYDPSVFSESDFAASFVTDIPQSLNTPVTHTITTPNSEVETVIAPTTTSVPTSETSVSTETIRNNKSMSLANTPVHTTTSPSILEPAELETGSYDIPSSDIFVASQVPTKITTTLAATSTNLSPTSGILSQCVTVPKAPVATTAVITPTTLHLPAISSSTSSKIESINVVATSTTTFATSPEPGCSFWQETLVPAERPITPQKTTFSCISPQQIMPYPVTKKTTRVNRKRGKTAVITASPYKNELEESIKKKKLAEEMKNKRKQIRELKETQKKSNKKYTKKTKKVIKAKQSSCDSETETENTPCLFCMGLYLESNEGWASCSACGKWAHCSCAGLDDEDDEATFTCEFCEQ